MAKISANGAREVARVDLPRSVYVLTSDGRVLQKYKGLDSTFKVLRRGVTEEQGKKMLQLLQERGI